MPFIERLKKLKEEKHITTAQWALLSNVPASTISRILSGDTGSPNFETMVQLVSCVNGSLDDIAGLVVEAKECSAEKEAMYLRMIEEKENIIKEKEKHRQEEKREKYKVAIYALVMTAIVFLGLFIDILNRNIGWLRW